MKWKRVIAGMLIGSMSLLAGCTTGGKAPKVDVDVSPIKSAGSDTGGNEGLVIGSVTMYKDGEWFEEVMAGVRQAAKDMGVQLKEESSEGDVDTEKQLIQQFVAEDVDALVVCPLTADETGALLVEAEQAGIPAITWNTVVDADVTASVCVDPNKLGGATGEYLAEYIRTYDLSGLKVGLITNESYTIGVARCEGFKEAIKDLEKDGSITVVSEMLAETTDETTDAVKKMLSEHSDIDMIWCWNQTSLLECINVVREMGKKDITIMGTDMSVSIAKDMQGSDVNILAVTTQLPYNMGYKAVVNAVQAAKGKEVEKTVMIPTFTYVKSDVDGLDQYVESHEAFAK